MSDFNTWLSTLAESVKVTENKDMMDVHVVADQLKDVMSMLRDHPLSLMTQLSDIKAVD